jgi:carbamoyl-phosphate synthase large subunit
MKGDRLNALVLGVGGNVSQGILKALSISSLNTRVVGACISPLSAGLYTTSKAYICPRADAPEFKDWLFDVCRKETIHVVLSGVEAVLSQVAQLSIDLCQQTGAKSIVSSERCLRVGNDKLLTCQWLKENGLPYPRYAATDDSLALRSLAETVGYPLIAKPRTGKGAVGVLSVRTMRDLEALEGRPDYVVQEYLGSTESEYTAGCLSDRFGVVRGTIVMRRELLHGTTYRAEAGEFPEVRIEAQRIAEKLRPLGPCNMQFRASQRGPVCFEINVRFSGTTPLRARFGFNEVEWALRHLVLDEPAVDLPVITSGIALRYWNEVYVDLAAYQLLCNQGLLDRPDSYSSKIEDYGIRP